MQDFADIGSEEIYFVQVAAEVITYPLELDWSNLISVEI